MIDFNAPIKEIIAEIWKKRNIDGLESCASFITEHIQAVSSQKKLDSIPALNSWVLLFDEFLIWTINLAASLSPDPDGKEPFDAKATFYAMLTGTIVAHLFSIRQLVVLGFDLSAKQVLRSCCEHLDLLNLLILRPELGTEFNGTADPTNANAFWNKYLRRGKSRKYLHDLIAAEMATNMADIAPLEVWKEFRKKEDTVLSMAAHPSLIGCLTTYAAFKDAEPYRPGYLGVQSPASIRTLKYACHSVWEMSSLAAFPFGGQHFSRTNPPILKFDENDPLHLYIKWGRSILTALVVFITLHEHSHPELQVSKTNIRD